MVMNHDEIKTRLTEWLQIAQRLEVALNCPEPDETTIRGLLSRRQSLKQELEQMAVPGVETAPELRLLAQACIDSDRRAEEKARLLLTQAADALSELRNRRAAVAGYRRAVVEAARNGVTFFDGRI